MLPVVLALLLIFLAMALAINHNLRQVVEELETNIEKKTAQLQQEIEARKEAEQSCQESRQQLQTIVDNASAVIYLKDIDSRLWLVNREFEQIFNLSEQQVIGKSDYEIFPGDIADTFKANDAVVVETQSALQTEEVVIHSDGKPHTYLSLKFPLFNEDGKVVKIGGIATDITERKQLEEELRRSEARFRRLIESNVVAVVLGAPKGSITYANDAFLSLLGYERSALERGALTWQTITAPEYLYLMDELAATSKTSEQEWLHADGSRVPVLVSRALQEEPPCAITAVIDIRDRLQTNRSLQSRLNQQAAVARLGQEALSGIKLDELFNKAAALLTQNLEVEYAKVLELDRDGKTLRLRAGVGWHPGLVGCTTVTADSNSQAGYTLRSKQPVVVKDFQTETRFRAPALLMEHQVKSGISTSLGKPERPFGVLGVHASQQRRFSQDDINFLQAIANILTAAVERFASEQTLQGSEARFRRIFDSNMIGIGRWHNDGKITQANDALLKLLGYPQPSENLDLGHLTPPGYSEADRRALQEIRASGTCKPYEKEYLRSDGKRIPVLVGGCSLEREQGFLFVVDMTERKQLELALQQSVARLETLHKLDTAILELQRPAAMIRVAIACIEQLIPCQRAAIVTFKYAVGSANVSFASANSTGTGFQLPLSSFASLIDRLEQGECVAGTIDEVSSANGTGDTPTLYPELQALTEQGLAHFVCFPLQTSNELLGVLQLWVEPKALSDQQKVIAAEVSNQVAIALQQARLYQKVQRSNTELELRVAQRTRQLQEINQELEAFTYSISHDLRAPLRALQGFATALLEDYNDRLDSLGQEYAQRLVGAAKKMEQLIQDLLTYSRLSRTELRLHSVSLAAVVAEVQEQIGSAVTVETSLPEVYGNRTILSQVVSNLLSNALKFVAPGVEPSVRIWSEQRQNWVRLYIKDNGIGISEEHRERIFNVFERLHSQEIYPGTGIGLAIARKGIERLGGRIGLESTVGEGSCFWIELSASNRVPLRNGEGGRGK